MFFAQSKSHMIDALTGKWEVVVNFKPKQPGKYSETITVVSSDPDQPEQSFKVVGGVGDDIPPNQVDGGAGSDGGGAAGNGSFYDPNASQASGCGCGLNSTSPAAGATALGLLGLGLALRRRRRRS